MNSLLATIDKALQKEQWLIALDRDGTLVPYASRPEEATVDGRLRKLIAELSSSRGISVAVISARSAAQLKGDFNDVGAILAGNYGMEVNFPDGRECILPAALDAVPRLKTARDQIFEMLENQDAIFEDHGYSLCLHWHKVPIDKLPALHDVMAKATSDFPDLIFKQLPTSYEVFPGFPWHKGLGLDFIASNTDRDRDTMHFFAGDTTADTPGFEWTNERGGISVRVGPNDNLGATYRVDSPEDLHAALEYIARKKAPIN